MESGKQKAMPRAKYSHLLSDPDVNRWYRNVSRGSNVTADVYLRRLEVLRGQFLQMLEYKAARAGVQVVKVNPRGTSREGDKSLDRDFRASLNILMRGWGSPKTPVEMGPLLVEIPASSIIEAGSPNLLGMGSSRAGRLAWLGHRMT